MSNLQPKKGLELHATELAKIPDEAIEVKKSEFLENKPTTALIQEQFNDWLSTVEDRDYQEAQADLALRTNALMRCTDEMLTNQGIELNGRNELNLQRFMRCNYALALYIERSIRGITGEAPLYSETMNYLTYLTLTKSKMASKVIDRFDSMIERRGASPELSTNLNNAIAGVISIIQCIDGYGDKKGLDIQDILAEKVIRHYPKEKNPEIISSINDLYKFLGEYDENLSVLPCGKDDAYKKIDLGLFVPYKPEDVKIEDFQEVEGEEIDFRDKMLFCQIKSYQGSRLGGRIFIHPINFDVENVDIRSLDDLPEYLRAEYDETLEVYEEEGMVGFFIVVPMDIYDREQGMDDINREITQSVLSSGIEVFLRSKLESAPETASEFRQAS